MFYNEKSRNSSQKEKNVNETDALTEEHFLLLFEIP